MKYKFVPYIEHRDYFRGEHANMVEDSLSSRVWALFWWEDEKMDWVQRRVREASLLTSDLFAIRDMCKFHKLEYYSNWRTIVCLS